MRIGTPACRAALVWVAVVAVLLFGTGFTQSLQAASSGVLTVVSDTVKAADVALGDINHDGCPDLAVATINDEGILLFAGDRSRTWAPLTATNLPTSKSYSAIALADLDRNDLLDIVASEAPPNAGALVVYIQGPRGVWHTASGALPTSNCFAAEIVIEDFNRDGMRDIATAGPNGVWLIERTTTPDIWGPIQRPQAPSGNHNGLAFFDWSGDGRPDLVASCEDPGGGVRYWTQPAAGIWPRQPAPFPLRPFRALQTADLNHDGIPDVLAVHNNGLVIHSGEPGFPEMSAGFVEPIVQPDFVVGNWPADVDLEIFSCNAAGLSVFTGQPGSTWQLDSSDAAVSSLKMRDMADCDRDGAPDIAGFDAARQPCVYYNPPTSGTILWLENSLPVSSFLGQCFDAADPDCDGDADLMLGRDDSAVGSLYLEGDGGAAWRDETGTNLPGLGSFSAVAMHDFDYDGYADGFFLSKVGDSIHFSKRHPNQWNKSYHIGPAIQYGAMTFANFRTIRDVLVACPLGGEAIDFFQFTPGPNDGTWTRNVVLTGGISVRWVAAGDFNGDGIDEIASADSAGGLFLFTWSGTDWVVLRTGIPQKLNVTRFVVEDLDRDSLPDIVAIGEGDAVYVILNRQPDAQVLPVDDTKPFVDVSVADSNLDGIPDILATFPDGIVLFYGDDLTSWTKAEMAASPTAGRVFTDAGFEYLDKDGAVDFVAIEDNKAIRLFFNRDGSPPGGWEDFSPSGWIQTPNPDCRVKVSDNVALSTPTARYEYSTDAGMTWSVPLIPEIDVSPGARNAELTARAVPFPDSSRYDYLIRFTIHDVNGNVGNSPEYRVQIDAEPPETPSFIWTGAHEAGIWNRLNRIEYSWPAALDAHSGIAGYSVEVDRLPDTEPNASVEFGPSDRLQRTLSLADADNWYIHVRTVDRAGNVSTGTAHAGPFFIDRTPPDPPEITIDGVDSSAWPSWYKGHQTVEIHRGNDGGISAYAIRYMVTRNALSNPATGIEAGVPLRQLPTSTTITAYETWYVHAVTVDRAGNLSPVVHAGPLQIDINPPGGFIFLTPDSTTGDRVRVELTDMTDRGSGVYRWRLFYRLAGETDWDQWGLYWDTTPDQIVHFDPPDPLQEYQVAAQFEDNVGWISTLTNPRSTRFEQTITVETEVEIAHLIGDPTFELREGVKVYKGDEFIGTTDASGRITVPDVYIGDQITALYRVRTVPSLRRDDEELGGAPWAYRQYLTNVGIGDDGTMSGHIVLTSDSPLRLTLRRRNSLIGFHLVTGLSWNAGGVYLTELRHRWENAGDYLYNVSDGQMFLELVEVYENRSFWDDGADVRMYFNELRANARVDGLYSRYSYKNVELYSGDGHRTYIHELGHYGLGLYDEYKTHRDEDAWYCDESTCTLNREIVGGPFCSTSPLSACVMDAQWSALNFCDDLAANPHNHDTAQHRWRGMCCWDWLKFKFSDLAIPKRWLIRQPTDRGGHVAGPNAIPSTAWRRVHIMNVVGEPGYEWRFRFLKSDGTPFVRDRVDLVRYDGTAVPMGRTDRHGYILIHNIFPSDQACLHQWEDGWSDDDIVDHYWELPDSWRDVTGPLTESAAAQAAQSLLPAKVLSTDAPTTLNTRLDLVAGTTISAIAIHLTPPEQYMEPPLATVWHNNAGGLVTAHEMTWNGTAGRYEVDVDLPDTGEPSGQVSIRTIPWGGDELHIGGDFHLVEVTSSTQPLLLGSSGGALQIAAFDNSIQPGTILNISSAEGPYRDDWRIVKGPYRIVPNNGSTIGGPTNITITHWGAVDNVLGADMNRLGIYRWNETKQEWEPLESNVIADRGEVSAPMRQFGTYCLAAPPPVNFARIGGSAWPLYH